MSKRIPERKQRGFTLIEMMISLLLGSIAAIALTMITRALTQTAENEKMVVEASQMARAGIDMLRFDFMRTGMFYAANPRHKDPSDTDDTYSGNPNSLVSSEGSGGGTHRAFLRNPIVHLNPNTTGPDTVILVGNFIGDTMYEGAVDAGSSKITIYTPFSAGRCIREFDGRYAFAHLVNATGQTHEVKVSNATLPDEDCSSGVCSSCEIDIVNGEIIADAFGERNVKVGANQAVMYRVETIEANRKVLMRYFIDYDTTTAPGILADPASAITAYAASTAVVIAENVVDFQVWFRAVDPGSTGNTAPQPVADQAYYPDMSGGSIATLPKPQNVIVDDSNAVGTASVHLPMPEFSNINSNVVFPEHVRSAIISLAVRTEKTDQQMAQGADTDPVGQAYSDELAAPPTNDVGRYRVRRFTVEVKLPNIQSQMALFQASTNLSY